MAATAAASDTAAATATVGELVVVAQKREQKIESVPVAITAFSAKQRDILGIRTVQELSDFTPGLSYYAIADRAYIRGIGRNTVNLATAAGVAIYYNGIYYGANGSISLQHDSLFIGNIEVDRGPQNTLHGSNADGGVINYISKRPTDTLTAELRGGVANYDYYFGEGVISGPLNDNWKFRIGGSAAQQNGGYFHNLIGPPEGGSGPQGNGGKWWYEEGQLEGKVGDHLDVWAMISSGEFVTNFHPVATQGASPETPFLPNGAGVLTPNTFFGLCAVNAASHPECFLNGPPGSPGTVIPGSAVAAGPVIASQFPGNNPSTANPHTFIETSTQHNSENDNIALATTLTYHLPGLDIEYLGGYQRFFYHLFFGPGVDSGLAEFNEVGAFGQPVHIFPSGEGTLFDERDQNYSNEINFISTAPGPFQYLLGAYWFHEHFAQPIGAACFPNQPEFHSPVNGPPNPDGCAFNQNGIITYNDYAGFGHFSYKFNPQWEFAGGIRYTADHRAGQEFVRDIAFCSGVFSCASPLGDVGIDVTAGAHLGVLLSPPPAGAGPAFINSAGFLQRALSASWSAVTGDATINWTPDPTTLAYFRYARGYKAGGFAAGTFQGNFATGTPAFTNPETLDSFELGLKKTVGSTFQLNGDVFYYDWTNDQQPLTVNQSGVLVTSLFNIPSVREYGIELEGVWRPIDPLTFMLSYAYLNTNVTSHLCVVNADDPTASLPGSHINGCGGPTPGGQPINLQGSELPESPPNKISLNGQYVFTFDPGKLTLSASFIWKDKTYGDIFNNPLNLAPAYYTLNLRAVWDDARDRYSVIGYVNNVTNTTGFDNVTQATLFPGFPLVRATGITAPLTAGVELQIRFK
ncbi:MAG TPA: TonB-dependent receptor [Caulobacteraceae bacterium]